MFVCFFDRKNVRYIARSLEIPADNNFSFFDDNVTWNGNGKGKINLLCKKRHRFGQINTHTHTQTYTQKKYKNNNHDITSTWHKAKCSFPTDITTSLPLNIHKYTNLITVERRCCIQEMNLSCNLYRLRLNFAFRAKDERKKSPFELPVFIS